MDSASGVRQCRPGPAGFISHAQGTLCIRARTTGAIRSKSLSRASSGTSSRIATRITRQSVSERGVTPVRLQLRETPQPPRRPRGLRQVDPA
jgi:hypothetical protein